MPQKGMRIRNRKLPRQLFDRWDIEQAVLFDMFFGPGKKSGIKRLRPLDQFKTARRPPLMRDNRVSRACIPG